MGPDKIEEFRRQCEALNELVLERGGLEIKRFLGVDANVYREGALPARTKELLGLVASLVLRCDDCVSYHLIRCREEGVADDEFAEALAVGLTVGGSVTIPHLRRAFALWDELTAEDRD